MDPLEALSMDAAQATAAACMGCVGGTQCENLSATGVSWATADDANPTAIAAITPRESIFISHPPKIVLRTSMVLYGRDAAACVKTGSRSRSARRNDGQQLDDS